MMGQRGLWMTELTQFCCVALLYCLVALSLTLDERGDEAEGRGARAIFSSSPLSALPSSPGFAPLTALLVKAAALAALDVWGGLDGDGVGGSTLARAQQRRQMQVQI